MQEGTNKSVEQVAKDSYNSQKVSFKMPLVGQPLDSNRSIELRSPQASYIKEIDEEVIKSGYTDSIFT